MTLRDVMETEANYYLVMDYVKGLNFKDFLSKRYYVWKYIPLDNFLLIMFVKNNFDYSVKYIQINMILTVCFNMILSLPLDDIELKLRPTTLSNISYLAFSFAYLYITVRAYTKYIFSPIMIKKTVCSGRKLVILG